MKIVFFTYFYSPDLSPGAFRSEILAAELIKRINVEDQLHIITTYPNRYKSFNQEAEDIEQHNNLFIHRLRVPQHGGQIFGQIISFSNYFFRSFSLVRKINPQFMICTTGRHMTSLMTWIFSVIFRLKYYVDFRDIFSEGVSEIFDKNNKLLRLLLKNFFLFFEKIVLKNATGVNAVSEAFFKYYKNVGMDVSRWSFYPNGVDELFINIDSNIQRIKNHNNRKKTVLYVGNIGKGQGLEIIIPQVAKRLEDKCNFLIIGDGVMKQSLEAYIKEHSISNVKFIDPIQRDLLINYYFKSDILFLHLNKLEAFKRSLPSKLFEYAVIGKPIIAGLSGYSEQFLSNHIPHAQSFTPGDVDACVDLIESSDNISIRKTDIEYFIEKFSRKKIMSSLSDEIFKCI